MLKAKVIQSDRGQVILLPNRHKYLHLCCKKSISCSYCKVISDNAIGYLREE